jgi:hypothetical protein
MQKGLYGVMVYRVDTRYGNDRRSEVFFGNSVSNGLGTYDPNAKIVDNGNDPRYPKFAYFIPVDGGPSNPWIWFSAYSGANNFAGNFLGVEGDSFITDGIRIRFLKTGDYNQVQITLEK